MKSRALNVGTTVAPNILISSSPLPEVAQMRLSNKNNDDLRREDQIRHDLQEPVEEEPETLEGAVRAYEPEPATTWPTNREYGWPD